MSYMGIAILIFALILGLVIIRRTYISYRRVTLKIQNDACSPFFKHETKVNFEKDKNLLYYLKSAAQRDKHFEFSTRCDPQLGYVIERINGFSHTWTLQNEHGVKLRKGLSEYIPTEGDIIVFNCVQKRSLLKKLFTVITLPVRLVANLLIGLINTFIPGEKNNNGDFVV